MSHFVSVYEEVGPLLARRMRPTYKSGLLSPPGGTEEVLPSPELSRGPKATASGLRWPYCGRENADRVTIWRSQIGKSDAC